MVQEAEKLVIVNAPAEWMRKLADDIKARALDIEKITQRGAIAVMVHDSTGADGIEIAGALGWDGCKTVFALPDELVPKVAAIMRADGDSAAADWFTAKPAGRHQVRMFMFLGEGTLCLNFDRQHGWRQEPGTADRSFNN